jgi:hypothetical protein
MEGDSRADPECILTQDYAGELQETLLLRNRVVLSPAVETALSQYANSLEQMAISHSASPDDPYTRGFVAGMRAAAKVAANVNGQ